jgi:hypothetical protein
MVIPKIIVLAYQQGKDIPQIVSLKPSTAYFVALYQAPKGMPTPSGHQQEIEDSSAFVFAVSNPMPLLAPVTRITCGRSSMCNYLIFNMSLL